MIAPANCTICLRAEDPNCSAGGVGCFLGLSIFGLNANEANSIYFNESLIDWTAAGCKPRYFNPQYRTQTWHLPKLKLSSDGVS